MQNEVFGVKLIYRYTLRDAVFYEESVLRVHAASQDEATANARNYAHDFVEREYTNLEGETVTVRLCDIADCCPLKSVNSEIEEIYSGIFRNESGMSEDDFLELRTDTCSREERKPLRHV